MRSFVSVCTGDKYPNKYVEILYNMVSRHTSDFKFYCVTDRRRGFSPHINEVIIDNIFPTWWNKVHIFNKDMPFEGTVLYMDLDIVVFRNIDKLWSFARDNSFAIIQDFNRCRIKNYHVKNSSVMKWQHGRYHHLYDSFIQDPKQIMKRYRGDQDYVTAKVPEAVTWPTEWIMSYKWEIGLEPGEKRNSPNDKFVTQRYTTETFTKIKNGVKKIKTRKIKHNLPEDCSVAVFHGKPNPEQIVHDPLVIENWR